MTVEIFRLLLGVAIAVFHRPLAGTILKQERVLDTFFRSRGIQLPPPMRDSVAYNLFFLIGIFTALFQAARIWLML